MLSVITPSIRKDGLTLVRNSLQKQEFKDFEWLIGSKFDPEISEARWIRDDFEGGFWTLGRCWNKLYKNVQGKLIVHWQDWVWAKEDALQKFWDNYQSGKKIISGIGDQYEGVNKYGRPSSVKVWVDPRRTLEYGSLYECNFQDIEYNFCAVEQSLIQKYGGADSGLDFLGFGGDLLQMSDRMNDGGEHFWLDQSNESFSVYHEREKKDWDKNHILFNGRYNERKKELIEKGQWPILKCP